MGLKVYQVDAFTNQPFGGNPAAVCILPEGLPQQASWMQKLANEMNLSETAFLQAVTAQPEEGGYSLRWFTPKAEVDLCGHATLASAHILWECGHLPANVAARFHTRSGLLTAQRQGDWIQMDFPAKLEEPVAALPELNQALGVQPVYTGKNQFDYLVVVASEAEVRSAQPDFGRLQQLPVRGTILTARSETPGYDFVSRFFAPAVGVNEDPVTGSAHTCLGPYWGKRLAMEERAKEELVAYQASPRGGVLRIRLAGERVLVAGQAVTVMSADLSPEAAAGSGFQAPRESSDDSDRTT
jgi:PhzF family phenazine biosynthesis protein